MRYLEAKSVNDFITLCLLVLHQNGFLGLIGDWPSRTNARPVEDVQVIQAALCLQQLSSLDWLLRRNRSCLRNQRQLGVLLSQINHFSHSYQLVLGDVVSDLYAMRDLGVPFHRRSYFGIQITTIQIVCRDAIAIVTKFSGREGRARVQFQSGGRGQLLNGDAVVPNDLNVLYQRLSALLN